MLNTAVCLKCQPKGQDRSRPGPEFDEKEHCCDSCRFLWFKFFFALCHEDRGECSKCSFLRMSVLKRFGTEGALNWIRLRSRAATKRKNQGCGFAPEDNEKD